MPRLWAKTVSFESVEIGDQLPILVKWETRDTIDRFISMLSAGPPKDPSTPPTTVSGPEPIDGELPAPALVAYVSELLEKAFPIANILAQGSRLDLRTSAPVRPEDTISISGEVVAKREESGYHLVECRITIEKQDGQTVAEALAVVSL